MIFYKGAFGRVLRPYQSKYPGYLLRKYSTEVFGKLRYGRNTLPKIPVRFGTNSIPVPHTSVNSVRAPKTPRVPVCPAERTLGHLYPNVPQPSFYVQSGTTAVHFQTNVREAWTRESAYTARKADERAP